MKFLGISDTDVPLVALAHSTGTDPKTWYIKKVVERPPLAFPSLTDTQAIVIGSLVNLLYEPAR